MELIETIKIEDGKIYNLKWHNQRCNRSRLELFGCDAIRLEDYIKDYPPKGLFRCRVLYSEDIIKVEYIPYKKREFKSFKIVSSDIEYSYKYSNRDELDRLKEQNIQDSLELECLHPKKTRLKPSVTNYLYDDIIIQKDGLLTDSTIANIAFFDGENWITPKKPLLRGTVREKLLNQNFLIEKDINSDDLRHFCNFALMNAMIGFQIQKNITIDIDKKERICL